jgi:hypothetical protein
VQELHGLLTVPLTKGAGSGRRFDFPREADKTSRDKAESFTAFISGLINLLYAVAPSSSPSFHSCHSESHSALPSLTIQLNVI